MPEVIQDGQDIVLAEVKAGALNQDGAARYRISQPLSLYKFNSFRDNLFSTLFNNFGQSITNNGTITHNNTEKCYTISSGTTVGTIIAQTRRYMQYQPGRGQQIKQTFIMGSAINANQIKEVGYFDQSDGVFLRQTPSGISLVLRNSATGVVVERVVNQAAWNGDPLNGLGISGYTINLDNIQLMSIQYQWLGAGAVQVSFNIDGQEIVANTFYSSNDFPTIYMLSGSLPLRYQITNSAPTTASEIKMICGNVVSDAGNNVENEVGDSWAVTNPITGITVSTTITPIIGIRLKTTFLSNTNRGIVIPGNFSVLSLTRDYVTRMIYNPTITAGTWTSVNAQSMCEFSTNLTMTAATGRTFDIRTTNDNGSTNILSDSNNFERMSLDVAGTTSDIIVLAAQTQTATGVMLASIGFKEFPR
jgi:hypothetical protein